MRQVMDFELHSSQTGLLYIKEDWIIYIQYLAEQALWFECDYNMNPRSMLKIQRGL